MKVLAITGGSGSGKSTVLNGLKDHFGKRLSMLSLDDYYRPKEVLPVDDNGETNFDVPEAIDHPQLHADILKLAAGERVTFETYTYNKSLMKSEVAVIEPREWLVVEGALCAVLSKSRRWPTSRRTSTRLRGSSRAPQAPRHDGAWLHASGGGISMETPCPSSRFGAHRAVARCATWLSTTTKIGAAVWAN